VKFIPITLQVVAQLFGQLLVAQFVQMAAIDLTVGKAAAKSIRLVERSFK
jgi:hypothetical protein